MQHRVGLGFRKAIAQDILSWQEHAPDFIEVVPENWMNIGGYWKQQLQRAAERYPITAHGLSLSIGSVDPLDLNFLKRLKIFLDTYNIDLYSEHLSFSKCQNAHLYELLPLPFTQQAANFLSNRIQQVQDILRRPLVLENVSYYSILDDRMEEVEFLNEVVRLSGCKLLLDINNVVVNASNHGYDPLKFVQLLALESVAYVHMAGHLVLEDGFRIDTHDNAVPEAVFELFEQTMALLPPNIPILLERDQNFPPIEELMQEITRMRAILETIDLPNYG